MKTGKVLVTGSAGFIGFHLAQRLLREGKQVLGLDNRVIIADKSGVGSTGAIRCRQRLGGMLNYYYREAA
jgi:nucleoside-diphosphate-sugar epimerase